MLQKQFQAIDTAVWSTVAILHIVREQAPSDYVQVAVCGFMYVQYFPNTWHDYK
jgi:hypothetical protein